MTRQSLFWIIYRCRVILAVVRLCISDVNKTKFLRPSKTKTKTAAYKTETKTTGSKQRHLADLTKVNDLHSSDVSSIE